jgi:hypothetical protein
MSLGVRIDVSHSVEAKDLVRKFVTRLAEIPDSCAGCFLLELIDELKEEFFDA